MIKGPPFHTPERRAWLDDLSVRLRWLESLYVILMVILAAVAFRRHWAPWLAWFLVYQAASSAVAMARCWRLYAQRRRKEAL